MAKSVGCALGFTGRMSTANQTTSASNASNLWRISYPVTILSHCRLASVDVTADTTLSILYLTTHTDLRLTPTRMSTLLQHCTLSSSDINPQASCPSVPSIV